MIQCEFLVVFAADVPERSLLVDFVELRHDVLMPFIGGDSHALSTFNVRMCYVAIVHDVLEDVLGDRVE